MTPEDLLQCLPDYYSPEERELVRRACELAVKTHTGQLNNAGRPRLDHPLAVACILAELGLDASTLAAGLLHDVLLDGQRSLKEIEQEYSPDVARILRAYLGLARLLAAARRSVRDTGRLLPTPDDIPSPPALAGVSAARVVQRMLLSAADDLRALLVQMANHLDRARNWSWMPIPERLQVAQEAMELYAPLANRLGMWQMKSELEDLGFRQLNPGAYFEIDSRLEDRRLDRQREMQAIKERIETLLARSGFPSQVTPRPKQIYALYTRLIRKNKPLERVHDLRGVRVVVEDIVSCYGALGVLHSVWRPMMAEFDDYIAVPKDNFYRSLHTTLVYDDGRLLEVQIRTPEMHQEAELGVAAHWRNQGNPLLEETFERRLAYLRTMLDWRQNLAEGAGTPDPAAARLFEQHIYVFTPQGDIIGLPPGATPLDFAYAVHTQVGHRCRAARVNGKPAPLDWKLKTGDQVEAILAEEPNPADEPPPQLEWLSAGFVRTRKARRQIRRWLRQRGWQPALARKTASLPIGGY